MTYFINPKSKTVSFLIILALWMMHLSPQAQAAKAAEAALHLREAFMLRSLLDRAQVEAETMDHFLAIQDPLEQAIKAQPAQADPEKIVRIKLSEASFQHIFAFLAGAIVSSNDAAQIHTLLTKLRKHLPKDARIHALFQQAPKDTTVAMSPQEAELLYTLLANIELQVSEIPSLVALQQPLEAALKQAKGKKKLQLKYAKATLGYLQVFSTRFVIQGGYVKPTKQLLERLIKLAQ